MTLQERILEVLGEGALDGKALYSNLSGELPSAVDFALRGLMRDGKVKQTDGTYLRPDVVRVIEHPAVTELMAAVYGAPPVPITVKCRRCKSPKPLEAYGMDRDGLRLKTCLSCQATTAAKRSNTVPVVIPKRTFSPGFIARAIERQTEAAKLVQQKCNELSEARQKLVDAEELVRIATWRS